jgi:hypothetical protein
MVLVLLLVLVMGIVQAALLVHARNVAAATAADAARYAAASGRQPTDAVPYAVGALHDSLGSAYADRLSCSAGDETVSGVEEVRVDCGGTLPLRLFGVGSVGVHVVGHALREAP